MSIQSSLARTAFETLRSNPMHTFMSILGLVIGVAALVGVLSLADGMEDYAREQIATTTDLNMISVSSVMRDIVDGVAVPREDVIRLGLEDWRLLGSQLSGRAQVVLSARRGVRVEHADQVAAAFLVAATPEMAGLLSVDIRAGAWPSPEELETGAPIAVLAEHVARNLVDAGGGGQIHDIIGREITVDSLRAVVRAVVDIPEGAQMGVLVPFLMPGAVAPASYPSILVVADRVEEVPALVEEIGVWADARYDRGRSAVTLATNRGRVEQAEKAVRLFKVIMGLITGISVIVGGVGIMNVLMMSVSERTREIGVRKAAGARRRDIVFQFMVEAVAISAAGSMAGLVVGLVSVYAVTPAISALTDVPFQAGFSWVSFSVVVAVAAATGILFGTYPAWRASRLNPVDAIRHE